MAISKTVKKAAPKKKPVKKASPKKSVKKVAVKKSVSKKAAVTPNKPDTQKPSAASTPVADSSQQAVTQLIETMQLEQKQRDQQIGQLIKEMHDGMNQMAEGQLFQKQSQDKAIKQLAQGLEETVTLFEKRSDEQEKLSLTILNSLSDSIQQDHKHAIEMVHEQDKVHHKRYEQYEKVSIRSAARNRWVAIPSLLLAVVGIIYMFYLVTVMEESMTAMSKDMGAMKVSMESMTQHVSSMTLDTNSMAGNMQTLNRNITQMSIDMNNMSNTVSPAMRGMRDMMPWSP